MVILLENLMYKMTSSCLRRVILKYQSYTCMTFKFYFRFINQSWESSCSVLTFCQIFFFYSYSYFDEKLIRFIRKYMYVNRYIIFKNFRVKRTVFSWLDQIYILFVVDSMSTIQSSYNWLATSGWALMHFKWLFVG